jgi:hypothetical protein
MAELFQKLHGVCVHDDIVAGTGDNHSIERSMTSELFNRHARVHGSRVKGVPSYAIHRCYVL